MTGFSRRTFLVAAASFAVLSKASLAKASSVGLLLPGKRDDGGFMQAGFEGFERAIASTGATPKIVDGVKPEADALRTALETLANGGAEIIAAHGGQCDSAVRDIAPRYPGIQFVVIQGSAAEGNTTSYEVLQEQSAWLAGAYAALTTKTGVVGHISGIRVPPGLKGRAGYAAGVATANPDVKLLTTFCGQQDDSALARDVTLAQAAAGADIIFTMLNAGRTGAIDGCREAGISQIGNVKDWYPVAPDVFVASAIADVSVAMETAVVDLLSGTPVAGSHRRMGLADGAAVSLAMSPDTPSDVRKAIDEYAEKIAKGEIEVPVQYDGAEFDPT